MHTHVYLHTHEVHYVLDVCVCVCVCVCVYIHIYIYIYVCMYVCMYVHTHNSCMLASATTRKLKSFIAAHYSWNPTGLLLCVTTPIYCIATSVWQRHGMYVCMYVCICVYVCVREWKLGVYVGCLCKFILCEKGTTM